MTTDCFDFGPVRTIKGGSNPEIELFYDHVTSNTWNLDFGPPSILRTGPKSKFWMDQNRNGLQIRHVT